MILKNKVIVITGGARGLGKAMADLLMQKEARVITCDIGLAGGAVEVDVTKEEEVLSLAEDVSSKFGGIDIWINNAGIWMPRENIEQIDMKKARKLFDVNLFGTMHGMRAALKFMKLKGSGTIVNIISTTAFDGMNGSSGSTYVSSKYALRGLTNTVRDELKDTGIQLIGVYPGGMRTEIFSEQPPLNINEFMSAEEVAQKIVENLEAESPEAELILKRLSQATSADGTLR